MDIGLDDSGGDGTPTNRNGRMQLGRDGKARLYMVGGAGGELNGSLDNDDDNERGRARRSHVCVCAKCAVGWAACVRVGVEIHGRCISMSVLAVCMHPV